MDPKASSPSSAANIASASASGETLWSSLRALPRPAWVLFIGTFLNKFGAFVVPFLTLYLTSQGCTVSQIGWAVGAYGVGNLFATLVGGYLADHLGRRKTIALSMFSAAAMMLLLSQARRFPAILVLAALAGLTGELYRPASVALLTDVVPPARRITAFAALRLAFNAGFAFGPAMAGFLATFGYFWLFAGDAATSLLYGFVALLALPRRTHTRAANASWSRALGVLWRDRRLHQWLVANLALAMVLFQTFSTFGLYVTHLGFSPAVYGAIISLNGVLVVCCELPLTVWTKKFPARRVMAVGYVVCCCGFALNAFAHGIVGLVACMVLLTAGEMIAMPTSVAYLADLAPADMRGRYLGVSGLTWAAALMVGPGLGLKLFAFNPGIYWCSCAALGVFAAIAISLNTKTASSAPEMPEAQ